MASLAGFGDRNPAAGRAAQLVGHYSDYAIPLFWLPMVISAVPLGLVLARHPVLGWLPTAMSLCYFLVSCLGLRHERGALCERCIHEWPLNAPETAAKHRTRLIRYHSHVLRAVAVVAVLAVVVIASLVGVGTWWPALPAVIGVPLSVWLAHARRLHGQVQPWCPVCGNNRPPGDDEDVVPSPDPDPAVAVRA